MADRIIECGNIDDRSWSQICHDPDCFSHTVMQSQFQCYLKQKWQFASAKCVVLAMYIGNYIWRGKSFHGGLIFPSREQSIFTFIQNILPSYLISYFEPIQKESVHRTSFPRIVSVNELSLDTHTLVYSKQITGFQKPF